MITSNKHIRKVNTLIIGAGPAALAFLSSANQSNNLKNLVNDGLAILEQGNTLGGGSLQNYIINSNTPGSTF